MDYSRKLRTFVAGAFLLMSGIGAQNDGDFIQICDSCHMDSLLDCSLAEMIQVNMTVHCPQSAGKACTLGIDQSFDDFDNLTMQEVNKDWICLFKDDSVTTPILTDINPTALSFKEQTEGFEYIDTTIPIITDFEHLKPTTEGTLVQTTAILDSLDYQGDQPTEIIRTFRSDPGPDSANKQPPPDEMITCFVCNSSSDTTCSREVDHLKTIKCPKATGCIAMYSNGNVIRGCGSAIGAEDIELCHKPNNTTCDCCMEANCNKIIWQQCHNCNSKDDPNCALWAKVEHFPMADCSNYNDKCLIRITKDGDTVRECTRADTKCPGGAPCSVCEGPLCNSGVFPEDRRRCIQCQLCDDAQDPTSALPCARYDPNEQCYLYVTANSKMIRGCISNTTEMLECQKNEPKCITCADANGCNSAPLMKDARLSCSKCDSKVDPSCAWAQPSASVKKCTKKVLYYLQETCMTDFDPAKDEAVRDCSFDYGVCIPGDQNCRTCSGDGCNRGNLKVQKCIQCCSDHPEQSNCSSRAEGIPPTKCGQETQTYQTKGCFSMTKGNITTRGCIAGLLDGDFKLCKTEGNSNCDVCMEDGCNNRLAPSRGLRTGQISLFAIICAIFITI